MLANLVQPSDNTLMVLRASDTDLQVIFLILTSAVVTVCETAPTVHKRNMEAMRLPSR